MGNFKWDLDLAKKLAAEFTGTAMLMTLGCSIAQFSKSYSEVSLGWGFSYAAAIHTFAFLSGAHINPWVSVSATIVGVMEWELMLCYIACQLLGAFGGFGLAYVALPENSKHFCTTMAGANFDEWKIILVEFMLCGFLLFAYCAIWDKRSKAAYDSYSLRIGFIIAALCFAGHFHGGCSVNFFRSLAPAVVQLEFDGLWAYFVGQLVAAILVPVLWRFVIADEKPEPME
ncbi:aquaporin-2-like [Drosophila sulfurigaster albostrigata]|uniref:aquaporin-2-like n=1 Tax=Drosophila sulfurigaster albostrigata TaxID=89887 RepID=UPI002D2184D3|nr:aquaporin-2-like [Drosophila sulfurigaster albostrigata]